MLSDSLPYVKKVYNGVGAYTFGFKIFDVDDLNIRHSDAFGTVTTLTTGQYTAVLSPDYLGGTVTVTDVTLPAGVLNIQRLLPYLQGTDWVNNDNFSMELLERTQDKMVMMIQQIGHIVASANSTWRGNWVTGTAYSERQLTIGIDGDWYACVIPHTSGTFATDVAAGNWEKALPLSDFTNKYNVVVVKAAEVILDRDQVALDKIAAGMSATNALVSEGNAAISAGAASTSAASSASFADLAEAYYDAFYGIADEKANKTLLNTGGIISPEGTTLQRPVGAYKFIRYNSDLNGFEGFNGSSWGSLGGGATGGGSDKVFIENDQAVAVDYNITPGKSAMSTGPITINDGVTVTVPDGSRWVIL